MNKIREIQYKSLEMAQYFVNFCEEHNLMCYLCGGGAIGAVRNKGFIPWDDDLDFFMPREDYEKLEHLWSANAIDRYYLSKSKEDYIDRNLFITIRDRETTFIKPYQQDLEYLVHGLAMDILPLDYYPKDERSRKRQIRWALIYSLFCAQTVPEKHGFLMKWGSKILLSLTPQKIRYIIWKRAEIEMKKYKKEDAQAITELCSGPYYMKKKYSLECFEDKIMVDFENTKMPIPIGYDKYLKTAFGDYMELPPLEKQKPHHDFVYLDLENSYVKYKGKYYGR